MVKRILWIVVAVVVCVGIYYWYTNRTATDALNNGGVSSRDALGTNSKSDMDRGVVNGSDIDGKPTDASTYGGSVSYADTPPPAAKASTGSINSGSASPQAVAQAPQVMPVAATNSAATPASLPASDTLQADSPNGMAFGGSGKFQWYRQGNLTWRINTQSGNTCIAFATMDEWQKPLVYTHGCGNA